MKRSFFGMLPLIAGMALLLNAADLYAQSNYPSKPISIYVPFGPGSGSDVYARYFGEKLSHRLGKPVIIENKPGAGGAVAVQGVKANRADGHTILLGSNSPMAANVAVYRQLSYDPIDDVVPIGGLTRSMAIIAVPVSSTLNSIEDLIERAKQEPELNMGTYSAGYQLAAAPFLKKAGISWNDIPYKGLAQTVTDLIGGQIDIAVLDAPGTTSVVNNGQVRALAVTGDNRHPELLSVPTLKELGFEDAVHYSWTSLWVKKGTKAEHIALLSSHLIDILNEPDSAQYVAQSSGEIMPFNPEEMRQFQKEEIERFSAAVETLSFEKL